MLSFLYNLFMKNKILWAHFTIFIVIFLASITFNAFLITQFDEITYEYKIMIGAITFVIVLLLNFSLLLNFIFTKIRRDNIKGSFDYYIEKQISHSGIGAIIFDKNDEIIWISDFIKSRFNKKMIGKRISFISKDFEEKIKMGQTNFRFNHESFIFEINFIAKKRLIVFKDVTNESKILNQYIAEKLVIGELEIDDFQQLQVTLSEEEIFSTQNTVIQTLDKLSEDWNFIYRQYVNGKYIFFTNKEILDKFIERKFDFVEEIRKKKIENGYLSVSIGIGYGTTNQKQLQDLAREGLKHSHARGGDQITLVEFNKKPIHYGSQFELRQSMSRVKISKIAKLFEEKLASKKITNVIIYGHKLADLDALGSSLGIQFLCNIYGKKAHIGNITFDTTTQNVIKNNFSTKIVDTFIKKSQASRLTLSSTLVVIVDTSESGRIENEKAFLGTSKENIFIFDHHRAKSQPRNVMQQNIYIDSNASSTCEIIVEIISFISRRIKLSRFIAQMLLNGIFLDTSSFTKSVSARTYTAASFLESQGADSAIASEIMKVSEEASSYIKLILDNLQEIKPGYFLASYEGEVPDDYISMAADEILRTKKRKASFAIAKSPKSDNIFKMSARGVETNVQKIAEQVGGGGHFNAAAATSKESLSVFIDNLRQAIVSEKGE